MSVDLSLVIEAVSGVPLREVVGSIDASTLPSTRFEVLILDGGADEATRSSWDRLAARRPNVRVVAAAGWEQSVGGEHVLVVSSELQLFPEALERLLDLAGASGADTVLGRQVQPGAPLLAALTEDRADLGETPLPDGAVVLRRSAALVGGSSAAVGGRTAVLASYPAALRTAEPAAAALQVTVERPALRWDGSELLLVVAGDVTGADLGDQRPVLLVRQLDTGLSFLLPTTGALDPAEGASGRWHAEGRLDLRTAAAGSRLTPGPYLVEVVLTGSRTASAAVPLPGAALPVALVDDLVVVPATEPDGPLQLDVGPTGGQPPVPLHPDRATVTESAAGSRLEVTLAGWHVVDPQPVPVVIALDRLRLPGQLLPRPSGAALVAFVSGLPGSYALSLQLGHGPLHPTGLTLQLALDGVPSVVATPPEPPAAPAQQQAPAAPAVQKKKDKAATAPAPQQQKKKKKKAPAPSASGPVAELRRALPRSWEPRLKRLARVPVLRATYRRLTGLTKG